MNSELSHFLHTIKEKTGIAIDAFTESMNFHVSTTGGSDIIMPSRLDFAEVYCDQRLGRTFFKFKFRNANLIGSIAGCTEVEKNYAYFILSLIESSLAKESAIGKNEYLKNILTGECSRGQILHFMRKFSVPQTECQVLVVAFPSHGREVYSFLEQFTAEYNDSLVSIDDGTCVIIKYLLKDGSEITTQEYANFLVSSIVEELGIQVKIGIGSIASGLVDAGSSFGQAISTIKLAEQFGSSSAVHSYKEFVLVKMLEEIPRFKLVEYLDVLMNQEAKELFSDEDMLNTAEEFLDNSLNVSETARKLFMHRNTLMYRLEKIEKMTGLNIKNFPDAVTFRLITILNKYLRKN